MKRKLFLSILFTVFCVVCVPVSEGQTLFNYARGGDTFLPSDAVVRSVDANRVIASYRDGSGYYCLALVDLTGIISAKMDTEHDIADIRIVGDDIFFCGYNRNSLQGFVGHARVSDMQAQTPHIELNDMSINGATITRLWRLAAYKDPSGTYNLVAVGDMWYGPTVPTGAYPCPSGTGCESPIVVHCTYRSGIFAWGISKILNDQNGHYEFACDVVETDNYVAVVSFPSDDKLIIHPCTKANPMATFDYYYQYNLPLTGAYYVCCKMKGDTIAVGSVFDIGSGAHEMQVRVVDLVTMNMPYAQTFDLTVKEEFYEMTYLPDAATLVLLHNHKYSPTEFHHTFSFMKPYMTTFPYNMEKVYDAAGLKFTSTDRLAARHIVGAGGDFWIMKDATYNDPLSTCYVTKVQQVRKLAPSVGLDVMYAYSILAIIGLPSTCNETYVQIPMTSPCITY